MKTKQYNDLMDHVVNTQTRIGRLMGLLGIAQSNNLTHLQRKEVLRHLILCGYFLMSTYVRTGSRTNDKMVNTQMEVLKQLAAITDGWTDDWMELLHNGCEYVGFDSMLMSVEKLYE